jgi:hypothetical protein
MTITPVLKVNGKYRVGKEIKGPILGFKTGILVPIGAILIYKGKGAHQEFPFTFTCPYKTGVITVHLGIKALKHLTEVVETQNNKSPKGNGPVNRRGGFCINR